MSASSLLKDLPSRNKDNFTKINLANHQRSSNTKKSTYISTKDVPPEQIIVTESTNILLRFLHQQWDKKTNKKRTGEAETQDETAAKKARLESDDTYAEGPSGGWGPPGGSETSGEPSGSGTSAGPSGPPPPYDPSSSSRFTRLL
uniref:DET1- and DDB1-associated protein 1 n=1 Tax=Tortanus dextrilobatus TaxID=207953 RepID=A0A0U2V876_9MAXI|nr:DET1- and DDB1-associated protein 1-like protein [Tortanus dextrilobatus]